MIEKPKRPKKIQNQDNKQLQSIQELIRRYDLDNTKVYDFLDELVGQINTINTQNDEKFESGEERFNKIENRITEIVLYENEEGALGTIPLAENKSNFSELEIIYGRNITRMTTGKIPAESLETKLQEVGATYLYIKTLTLSENDITSDYYRVIVIADGTSNIEDALYIYKVIGYKKGG